VLAIKRPSHDRWKREEFLEDFDYIIAQRLKRRLSSKIPVIDMRVFGSRARGDSEKDSDMDVFIEIERYTRETEEFIRDMAWETGLEYLVHISPLIFSKDDIEHSPLRSSPILSNVMEEGEPV
jgi:predicted nucleotidyltransferase